MRALGGRGRDVERETAVVAGRAESPTRTSGPTPAHAVTFPGQGSCPFHLRSYLLCHGSMPLPLTCVCRWPLPPWAPSLHLRM